ncbi:ABC transporter ATP-binding protein [Paenisporosarcina sp. OV554]|uniref:ABC transporter ATP-binding protein n=1 Tax=Paenisporosarcina sp. OV554 TaxID=2135694 RepID=UPI000D3608C7|nr:oligopeptide/dipeptide ABC transporter ATP-binding protein [Paenisporosarcina sp. OV554]PUB10629.1 oligopeptide transport system ATP-binding protein [Paenisporosarcina sp. OV554]
MNKLLEVKNLKKYYKVGKNQVLKAVDNVSFTIYQGETLGLVGESGCGKSTTGRTIIRLSEATEGEVIYQGKNVHKLNRKESKAISKKMQMVFQDPYASLNPRMIVRDIIAEGLDIHGMYKGKERNEKVYDLLETVGLNPMHANYYAHEFSGGQRQRIGIARALSLQPEFIIADEPISALDVSVQAQIVNLMMDLQKKQNLTYLFISHDLSMVRLISDRIGVMYLGNMMELTTSEKLYSKPLHPYTMALLDAIPVPDPDIESQKEKIQLYGEIPSPTNPPPGCVFQTRCLYAKPDCFLEKPILKEIEPQHFVACHLYSKTALRQRKEKGEQFYKFIDRYGKKEINEHIVSWEN